MKKLYAALIITFTVILCALAFTSCSSNMLTSPSGLVLNVEKQTLNWNMVKGAKFYTISISGQETDLTTKTTSVSLEKLDPGKYEIKVKANGDGKAYKDSDWSVFHFERMTESGLKYQLINNDTEYMLIGGGSAEGDVIMEDTYRGKPVTAIADKALYNNPKITSIKVGNNVKQIGSKAFAKCANLSSVIIPEGVTLLGDHAFQSCKLLTSITLPDTITVILPHTFAWCTALTDITIGQNVTAIGEYAFSNCESLVSITYNGADHSEYKVCLPDTLTYIDAYAFTDCYAMSDISLGSGIQYINSAAFMNCKAIEKLDLGESLVSIADSAFSNCVALKAVAIPDSAKTLGNAVFLGCTALSDISLGSGLETIGYYVFSETAAMNNATDLLVIDGWLLQVVNTELENMNISGGVHGVASYAAFNCQNLVQADLKGIKYVGYAAFYGCSSLYKVTFDDSLETLDNYAFAGCTYLKNVTLGNTIKSIGDYAFYQCAVLSEMIIPESVTSVGTRAFRGTAAYTKVDKNANKGVVYMGNWAVDFISTGGSMGGGGMNLTSARIEEGTRGIAKYTFSKQALLSATIPDSVEYIGRGAFYNSTLVFVYLPEALKRIDDYAFYGCAYTYFIDDLQVTMDSDIQTLKIPGQTEYIGRSAFYKCEMIQSVSIPDSVKTIGPYAFYGCKTLGATLELPVDTGEVDDEGNPVYENGLVTGFLSLGEGVESIGERAFQGCNSLVSVVIPDSVTELGERAFYKCASLKDVTVGSGLNSISDYTFYKCEALSSATFSNKVDSIGNYAFRGCISLKEIDLGSVSSIGRYSFYGCTALNEIVLPDSLTSIGDYAFRGCTNVTSFTIPDSVVTIGKHVFYGLNQTTLYLESDSEMPEWDSRFNSSFRPTFWNCTLSADGDYVVSFTKNDETLINSKATNGISDPCRTGYTFDGWTTEQNGTNAEFTSENVFEVENGTVLYAIWTKNQPTQTEAEK